MLKDKTTKIILCLLLLLPCCTKNDSDTDKVEYDYDLSEFAYNRERVIYFAKKTMLKWGEMKKPLSNEYYINDPQIYSFYGKDCNGENRNYIMVIMLSKVHKNFNRGIILTVNSKNEYSEYGTIAYMTQDINIKDYINLFRLGGSCP